MTEREISLYHNEASRVYCTDHAKHKALSRKYPAIESNPAGDSDYTQPAPCRLFAPKCSCSVRNDSIKRLAALGVGTTGPQPWWRAYPSAGGLHPFETYWLAPCGDVVCEAPAQGTVGYLLHYSPTDKSFEICASLTADSDSPLLTNWVCLVTICPWRTIYKYKRRAFRYYALDAGHILESLQVASILVEQDWNIAPEDSAPHRLARSVLQSYFASTIEHKSSNETVRREWTWEKDILCCVLSEASECPQWLIDREACALAIVAHSSPLLLSPKHFSFEIISAMSDHIGIVNTAILSSVAQHVRGTLQSLSQTKSRDDANGVLLKAVIGRRTGRAFDAEATVTKDSLWRILAALDDAPPFIQSLIFVHRVSDLRSGCYLLSPRQPERQSPPLQDVLRTKPRACSECPLQSPLFMVTEGDVCDEAFRCCGEQEQGRDSVFTVVFTVNMRQRFGEYFDAHVLCGLLGHGLYLASELEGFRANAMGYFDEEQISRMLFGRTNEAVYVDGQENGNAGWQPLYVIGVGRSTVDVEKRFTTGGRRQR